MVRKIFLKVGVRVKLGLGLGGELGLGFGSKALNHRTFFG